MHCQIALVLLAPLLAIARPIVYIPEFQPFDFPYKYCLTFDMPREPDGSCSYLKPGNLPKEGELFKRSLVDVEEVSHTHTSSDIVKLDETQLHPIAHRPLDVDKLPSSSSSDSSSQSAKRDVDHDDSSEEDTSTNSTATVKTADAPPEFNITATAAPSAIPGAVNPADYGKAYREYNENIAWKFIDMLNGLYENMGHKDDWEDFRDSAYEVDGVRWWNPRPPRIDDRTNVDSPTELLPSRAQSQPTSTQTRELPLDGLDEIDDWDEWDEWDEADSRLNPWNWNSGPREDLDEVVPTRASRESEETRAPIESAVLWDDAPGLATASPTAISTAISTAFSTSFSTSFSTAFSTALSTASSPASSTSSSTASSTAVAD